MKRFYNREQEISTLLRADKLRSKQGVFTLVMGRRRVGKTTLLTHGLADINPLYFFVSRKSEALLVDEFVQTLRQAVDLPIIGQITTLEEFFKLLFEVAKEQVITVIIDEFQDFSSINKSVFSVLQNLWDQNRATSKMHLIACGSSYTMMRTIFENEKEPLFGRADFKINVEAFSPAVLKQILIDYGEWSAKNLLDLYIFSGGVAKYLDLFSLLEAFNLQRLIEEYTRPDAIFLDEGKNRLIEEFGGEYGTYYSILSLIASSKTSRREIESIVEKNTSAYLYRLEHDLKIIKSRRPFGAKLNSKKLRYEISDPSLALWFRFIYKYQSLVESRNFSNLREIMQRDYPTFSGRLLEQLFRELFIRTGRFSEVGSFWTRSSDVEIDIIARDEEHKELWFCEAK
jgi:hypothetical protein